MMWKRLRGVPFGIKLMIVMLFYLGLSGLLSQYVKTELAQVLALPVACLLSAALIDQKHGNWRWHLLAGIGGAFLVYAVQALASS